jgi:hypothetical protein
MGRILEDLKNGELMTMYFFVKIEVNVLYVNFGEYAFAW